MNSENRDIQVNWRAISNMLNIKNVETDFKNIAPVYKPIHVQL